MTGHENDIDIGFPAGSGQLLMLNKKERHLIKATLEKALKSATARELLAEKLGSEYIERGKNLLKEIAGDYKKRLS